MSLKPTQTDPGQSLRLAYIIDSLKLAGTQRVLTHLVSGLSERGYKQRVYCLNNATHTKILSGLSACERDPTVIGKVQLLGVVGLYRLWAELRSWQPHIVQTMLPFSDVLGRTFARLAGVDVIVSSIRARNIDKQKWQFWLDRLTMPWADRVVFNAKHVIPFSEEHEGVRPEQAVYIPNGVQRESLRGEADCSDLGLPQHARVIGSIGRLSPQKGHIYLLRAFAQVLEQEDDTFLLIIGQGVLRNELEQAAMDLGIFDRIRFLGECQNITNFLECMDIYVQSSIFEGMPNAVMEAMVVGIPVIATRVDGTLELITEGKTGWLVPQADPASLAERILYVLRNESIAKQVAEAASRHTALAFSAEKMVYEYDKLYRELVSIKRRAELF